MLALLIPTFFLRNGLNTGFLQIVGITTKLFQSFSLFGYRAIPFVAVYFFLLFLIVHIL